MNTLTIQFFQVDMSKKSISSCSSCNAVQQNLNQAINDVKPLLSKLNTHIQYENNMIYTEDEARKHQITASPTIRIGNLNFFPKHLGKDTEERLWFWKQQTSSKPSTKTFTEVILQGYLDNITEQKEEPIEPYIMQFFDKEPQLVKSDSCCS